MRYSEIVEGGWVSTKTQNTKITPEVIGRSAQAVDRFIAAFNQWLDQKNMPNVKPGHPVGSGYYWQRDLKQNPTKEYGDIDYLMYVPRLPDTTNARNSAIYADLVKEFLAGNANLETDNGTNLIMKMGNDYIQVDLVHGYYEDKDWLEALVPEHNVKGVVGASLYSSLAEVLNLSIGSYGVQSKLQNGVPVSFRQSKNTELVTVSKDPRNWARDILIFYAKLAGVSPKIKPGVTGVEPGNTRFADIAAAIQWLGTAFEDNQLYGKSVKLNSRDEFIARVKDVFIAKMQAQINNPKFAKAETAAAKQKVKETIAKFQKAIETINQLL